MLCSVWCTNLITASTLRQIIKANCGVDSGSPQGGSRQLCHRVKLQRPEKRIQEVTSEKSSRNLLNLLDTCRKKTRCEKEKQAIYGIITSYYYNLYRTMHNVHSMNEIQYMYGGLYFPVCVWTHNILSYNASFLNWPSISSVVWTVSN